MPSPSHISSVHEVTLAREVRLTGIGLHTGAQVTLTLAPAEPGEGIVFTRSDMAAGDIPARHDRVTQTQLGTVISNDEGASVSTIEHLMAALAGCGIDNARIAVDGPEVPIMDGSSAAFVEAIAEAGTAASDVARRIIRILKPVVLEDGDKYAELRPGTGFGIDFEIDFPTPVIGRQSYAFTLRDGSFAEELARARTFGFLKDVEALRAMGLARGGSMENAIVIDNDAILNEEGLRFPDEFVRHKTLDAVGDLALAGLRIEGQCIARRSGHDLNNRLLRKLFATPDAWEHVTLQDT